VVAWGVHGTFERNFITRSFGGRNQIYDLTDNGILTDPIFLEISNNGVAEQWKVIFEPIQKYGPNDRVVELQFYQDLEGFNIARLMFGDDVNGKSPAMDSVINMRYRIGGGTIGRIGTGVIDVVKSIVNGNRSIQVSFRNISSSVGGEDKETIRDVKNRAPKEYSLHGNIVTGNDYANYANNFRHPYYGNISKSAAVLLTSDNRNIVDIYVLSNNNGVLGAASKQLKEALKTSISMVNVMTDEVFVKDGKLKLIDLDCKITIDRNSDARIVKNNIDQIIKSFFSDTNLDIGQPLYISNLISAIKSIDGVIYVNLVTPNRNILPSNDMTGGEFKVALDEIITLGKSKIDYFYDTIN